MLRLAAIRLRPRTFPLPRFGAIGAEFFLADLLPPFGPSAARGTPSDREKRGGTRRGAPGPLEVSSNRRLRATPDLPVRSFPRGASGIKPGEGDFPGS